MAQLPIAVRVAFNEKQSAGILDVRLYRDRCQDPKPQRNEQHPDDCLFHDSIRSAGQTARLNQATKWLGPNRQPAFDGPKILKSRNEPQLRKAGHATAERKNRSIWLEEWPDNCAWTEASRNCHCLLFRQVVRAFTLSRFPDRFVAPVKRVGTHDQASVPFLLQILPGQRRRLGQAV